MPIPREEYERKSEKEREKLEEEIKWNKNL